jgi:hypothetical protein
MASEGGPIHHRVGEGWGSLILYPKFVRLVIMRPDPAWWITFSELFINLSAGWFGATFIIPLSSKAPKRINLWLLTINIGLGIFFLIVSFEFKKLSGL